MQVDDYAEADRREVTPPVDVESATCPAGGTLDLFVKDRQQGATRSRRASEMELLIFDRRDMADSGDLAVG